MGYLETVEIEAPTAQHQPFRMPVQWVNRPNLDFRGFAGTIASGSGERRATKVRVLPSGRDEPTVARIVTCRRRSAERSPWPANRSR